MALNVKQKYPGTQGGAAQLYASDTRLSLRRILKYNVNFLI